MIELETERLRLRSWRNEDFEHFAAYYDDENLARYIGGTCDRATAWRRFAAIVGHWQLRGYGPWAVEEKTSGAFVGGVGLWFPEGWPELEVGYWLVAAMQGKGYASEALMRSKSYAFDELGAETLVSYIHPENLASIRVAERAGAPCEATIELHTYGPHQVHRYSS